MRIALGIIIFAGCGYLGMLLAREFKRRVRQLEELEKAMTQLEYMIDFSGVTLSEAFKEIAKSTESELKWVFSYVSERLRLNPGSDMQKVWQRAVDKYRDGLSLNESDVEIIKDFSDMLGKGNREKEKNNIKITAMRLKLALSEARLEREKNVKMYRGLGFLSGIFIVVVLL